MQESFNVFLSKDLDDLAIAKREEAKLQAKYPNLAKTSVSSSFLQKQLSKGVSWRLFIQEVLL